MLTDEMIEALKIYYLACRDIQSTVMGRVRYVESFPAWWDD